MWMTEITETMKDKRPRRNSEAARLALKDRESTGQFTNGIIIKGQGGRFLDSGGLFCLDRSEGI